MKKILRLTGVLVSVLSLSALAQNKTIYVNAGNTAAPVKDGISWATAYVSLQEAIDNAIATDKIYVAAGTYKPSARPAGLSIDNGARDQTFLVPEGVALYGSFKGDGSDDVNTRNFTLNPSILDGDLTGDDQGDDLSKKVDNVLHVVTIIGHATDTFVMDGFTVQNGYANAGYLTQLGTTNYYSFYGAGIFLRDAGGTFKNMWVKNNIVNASTASSAAYAGGIFIAGSKSVSLENCEIVNNKCFNTGAGAGYAGGLYCGAATTLKSTKIQGNSAKSIAGAVYIASGFSPSFENVDFEQNTAQTSAGAVYILGASAANKNTSSFIGGSFKNNEVTGTSATTGNGGGIYMASYASPSFTNVIFEGNKANYAGGAIYSLGNTAGQSLLTLSGGSFKSNEAVGYRGGAVYASNYTDVTATNLLFEANTAGGHGGAVFSIGAAGNVNSLSFTGCNFTQNTINAGSAVNGGAVHFNIYTEAILSNVNFEANAALNGSGGALYIAGTGASLSKLTINGGTFKGNTATGNGGAININTLTEATLNHIYAQDNVSNSAGGAIFTTESTGGRRVIENAVFYNNEAKTVLGGGAISISAAQVDIIGSTIYANKATAAAVGGGINVSSSANSMVNIYNTILYGNTSANSGADVEKGTLASVTLKHSLTQQFGTHGTDGVVVGADPQFLSVDPNHAQFLRLKPLVGSFTIDKGNNALANLTLDLAGQARVNNGAVDMGAYENFSTLPIKLSNFSAKVGTQGVQLSWQTAMEEHNDYFLLERSSNGLDYVLLSKQLSKGNTAASYTYLDASAKPGVNYYKLSQVDQDGTLVSFEPIVVNVSVAPQSDAQIYPNPAVSGKVSVSLTGQSYQKLELLNLSGQILQSQKISAADSEKIVDISNYPSGVYLMKLTGKGKSTIKKVLKP
ncbi:T9SS type A sorting domain-containing protein [Pedobacter nanyangensis]|uniref:T9SS type A sorting domain-containing protein n=1 Tax=Pedobacter nanyangensis TaxID=1562389 RepID=UPI0013B36B1A|nr:T9SS type A sorting domain-containing protein [Pedobacter nanyangensis]